MTVRTPAPGEGGAVRAVGGRMDVSTATVARLADDIRAGRPVDDDRFDALLALAHRLASQVHWTPMHVCRRVLDWLEPRPGERVLDVGSGVGKLCIVGALATQASFLGVEKRPHLVRHSLELASRLGAQAARFECRDAFALDWRDFQCVYLYNPFGELSFGHRDEDGPAYSASVDATVQKLDDMPAGTRVVTFHGFGGDMPDAYDLLEFGTIAGGSLALWRRS